MFNEIEGNKKIDIHCDNEKDFKMLYDNLLNLLFRVAVRITGEEDSALDLVHDSLIKANEKAICFPSLNDAKYWFIRVTRNACLNYVERKKREKKAYQKAFYEDTRKQDSGETELLKQDSIKKAKEALQQLPKKFRDVLVLKEYADMNYKEIAKVLKITQGNVKVRVFRAREMLFSLLGEADVYMPE